MNRSRKTKRKAIILLIVASVFIGCIGWGVYEFIMVSTGNTEAQIIARKRLEISSRKSQKAMEQNTQWYRDMSRQAVGLDSIK